MVLNRILGRRYFRLMDQLSAFAHERLHVVEDGEFWTGEPPRGIGEHGQRETIRELWENRSVIDDYVHENPDGIGQADLAVIGSWVHALADTFFVDWAPDGTLYFYAHDYLFDVCGMSLDIASSLSQIPAVIQTTLLPYAGHVVYDMSLWEMPVVIEGKMREVFTREFTEAYRAGRIIRTDSEFLAVAPKLEEQRIEAAMEEFRHEMELEERRGKPGYGQHQGALAGLSDGERRTAIARHVDELDQQDGKLANAIVSTLDSWVTDASPTTSLVELLELGPLPSEEEFITQLVGTDPTTMPGFSEIAADASSVELQEVLDEYERNRGKLVAIVRERGIPTIMAEMLTDPMGLQQDFEMDTPRETSALRRLAEAGGRMTLRTDELTSLADLPHPISGLCHYFWDGDHIEMVMADEIVPVVQGLDWQSIKRVQEDRKRIVRFIDNTAELRGMALYDDVLAECLAAYPDAATSTDELNELVSSAMVSEDCVSCILNTDTDSYLLHYELASAWCEERSLRLSEQGPFLEGPLGELLEGLLAQHRGKEPRPVTAEMMEHEDLFAWKEAQLPVKAMRDFLDANVPDERDDYFFADRVLDDLLPEAMWGVVKGSIDRFFDILSANDFVPDEAQLQQLLTLWQNLCNALPCWPNNGWSPNELLSRSTGRKVFYNPDGSIMRVGRNDPCPCGSGKKYKRCHGR